MVTTASLLEEPIGSAYIGLLSYGVAMRGSASLVWRHQLDFDDAAQAVKAALLPTRIEEFETATWPGTVLLEGTATLLRFHLVPESVRVLAEAQRLFAWLAPSRPEDLALYTLAGDPWLVSIAHERDALIFTDQVDAKDLRDRVGVSLSEDAG